MLPAAVADFLEFVEGPSSPFSAFLDGGADAVVAAAAGAGAGAVTEDGVGAVTEA